MSCDHSITNTSNFSSACISISSRHPFLKLHTVNLGTLNITMWKLDHDQTNSHSVINKSFGAKECWSYINIIQISTYSSWSKIYYKIFYSASIYIYIHVYSYDITFKSSFGGWGLAKRLTSLKNLTGCCTYYCVPSRGIQHFHFESQCKKSKRAASTKEQY